MRGILYNPEDYDLINSAGALFHHLVLCPECRREAVTDPEAAAAVSGIFDQLDAITSPPLDRTDYASGLRVCGLWMDTYSVLGTIIDASEDMITATIREQPTQH
jgi:hypothetical protein